MHASVRLGFSISSLLVFVALALLLTSSFGPHNVDIKPIVSTDEHAFRAPRDNVWADFDECEVKALYKFLYQKSNHLNLTKEPTFTGWENYVALVEVLRPNKTDVLPYLDGSSNRPERWARVSVSEGDQVIASITDYMVGPLPPNDETRITPLKYCYNSGRNYVYNPLPDLDALGERAEEIARNASDIAELLLGRKYDGRLNFSDPEGVGIGVMARVSRIEKGDLMTWVEIYRMGVLERPDVLTLLPQGLYFKLNCSSRDPAEWNILQWYYNTITYPSLESFRAAIDSPDFVRLLPNRDGDWTKTEDYESDPPGRSKPPPVSIQPYGPRYYFSKKDSYIEYLGWSFYLSTSAARGVDLLDIRFHDSRIMYSLGLQEALAHYAGSDPVQGGLEFLDTLYGFGVNLFELVPGHDCPAYADFIPMTYHQAGQTFTTKNAICIFEYTADGPLSRHAGHFYTTVSKNTYLVIRSVSSVGNYDFTIEYLFYLDGTMEVKVRASGFIWAAFYSMPINSTEHPSSELHEYGYRIQDAVASSMHDHVLNFRADFDIDGTANTLIKVDIEPYTQEYEWDSPEFAGKRQTMHLKHRPVEEETGLDWPKNSGAMYVILNNASLNEWGEKRGYRITPGTGMGTPSHLTVLNSTALGKSASWTRSDLWLLRQHDTEPQTASELNYLEPWDPLVDFEKMVNNEATLQEDLVVAFNLGGHHIPVSGDLPNTLMHTSATSVMFVPHNFGKRDLSRRTVSGVRVDGDGAKYFGGRYLEGIKLKKEDLDPDLEDYGDEFEVDLAEGLSWGGMIPKLGRQG